MLLSREILDVLAMSNSYKVRPSELLGIDCIYTSYCFDKACLYIKSKMSPTYDDKGKRKDGKQPIFPGERNKSHEENEGLQMLFKYNSTKG